MIDKLLSDDFVEFTKKVSEVKKKYEDEKKVFKDIYVKHKAELSKLEGIAKELYKKWEASGEVIDDSKVSDK